MSSALSEHEIARLFSEYGPMVYRRALRMLVNAADAEEATQDIFVRVLRSRASFAGRSSTSTWLYQITTNYCLNRLRDASRRRELFREFVGQLDRGDCLERPVDSCTLRWLLSNADEQQARAAIYVHLDGMSHAEAAELLQVSRRTVGNLLDRFGAWAREQMESFGPPASDPPAARSKTEPLGA